MLLDFSNIPEWSNTFGLIANNAIPDIIMDDIRFIDHEKMHYDTLDYLISTYEFNGLNTSIELLEYELDKYACEKYTSVKGYHACKITDENSYKSRGIIGLNREILLEIAIERFSSHATLETIIELCEKTDIACDEGKVFFFPSLINAKKSHQNHYLKCGSETLQGLANDLGLGCRGILSGQGRSCIIECDIPIKQIDQLYRNDIWRMLTTYILQVRNGRKTICETPDIGYATDCNLSPEHIKKFHYVDDDSYTYTLLRH